MLFCVNQSVNAESINKTISKSNIDKSTISISVKDINNGNTVYALNEKRLQNPASTLKLLTFAASIDTLGSDYNFETKLFKTSNNDLFIVLGADPYLTTRDLKNLFLEAKNKKILEPKNIFIDNTLLDSNEWGEGWQWDDDLSPLMPKYSIYNIDRNLIGIIINPTTQGASPSIYTDVFYPQTYMNLAVTGEKNNIKISRNNSISPDMLTVEGTVFKKETKYIPINNPSRYFKFRVEDAIRSNKIAYYKDIQNKKLPSTNKYLVSSVSHPSNMIFSNILKESNNFDAETYFKVAGAKYANSKGSCENSQKMLDNYLTKIGVDKSNSKFVDGSGVSKNNLVSADFMTNFLIGQSKTEKFSEYKSIMASPGEGTLRNRMLYFRNNLKAKTGTLSDISAIAGYITTQKGKTYAFDIMITDPKTSSIDKKTAEEYILRTIFNSY